MGAIEVFVTLLGLCYMKIIVGEWFGGVKSAGRKNKPEAIVII